MKCSSQRASIVRPAFRLFTTLAIALLLLASSRPPGVWADSSSTDDAASLIANVAHTYADSTRGVLAVRSTSDLEIIAPVFRKNIHDEAWFVFRDGTFVQGSEPPDPRQPLVHEPYREAYLGEYRYALAACRSCTPNESAIHFEGIGHDMAHAFGLLVVDRTTGRIVASSETPYKLPWPTRGGSLDATWGDVAGTWLPIGVRGRFVGRIGPFIGHAVYRQDLSDYRRYATVADAVRALKSEPEGG